jgi:hypothetical protein
VAAAVFKNVNITSVLLIVATFYAIQAFSLYWGEYLDWRRAQELLISKAASEGKISARPTTINLSDESQQAFNSAQDHLKSLYWWNLFLSYFRFLFEVIMPTSLLFLSIMREGRNLVNFVGVMLPRV